MLTVEKISDTKFLDCREKNPNLFSTAFRGGRRKHGLGRSQSTREDIMKSILKLMAGAAILVSV
ncbi:hypothetical protein ACCT09_25350, partial [Rhizobium ruizarguesonis]